MSRDATTSTHVRYFVVNGRSLVSLIECESEVHGRTECVWFLRDMTGKYVWRTMGKLKPDTRAKAAAKAQGQPQTPAAPAPGSAGPTTGSPVPGDTATTSTPTAAATATAASGDLWSGVALVNAGEEPDDRIADAMRQVLATPGSSSAASAADAPTSDEAAQSKAQEVDGTSRRSVLSSAPKKAGVHSLVLLLMFLPVYSQRDSAQRPYGSAARHVDQLKVSVFGVCLPVHARWRLLITSLDFVWCVV